MGVVVLTRAVLLVPELVKILHEEISAKACRKRGIGKLRKLYAETPEEQSSARILAEICRHCPLACELARKE